MGKWIGAAWAGAAGVVRKTCEAKIDSSALLRSELGGRVEGRDR